MTVRIRVTTQNKLRRFAILGFVLATLSLAGVVTRSKLGASRGTATGTTIKARPVGAIRAGTAVPPAVREPRPATGTELGRFEVPALEMSWVVLEGTDDKTLERSIGHVEGTALLGESGNIDIAGHRNTHFRKLEWIRRGDDIVLTSKHGKVQYRVDYIKLHKPTDVDVLDPAHGPAVTLITCFPFEYVGSAPLRFIVRAVAAEESLTRLQAPAARTTAADN